MLGCPLRFAQVGEGARKRSSHWCHQLSLDGVQVWGPIVYPGKSSDACSDIFSQALRHPVFRGYKLIAVLVKTHPPARGTSMQVKSQQNKS